MALSPQVLVFSLSSSFFCSWLMKSDSKVHRLHLVNVSLKSPYIIVPIHFHVVYELNKQEYLLYRISSILGTAYGFLVIACLVLSVCPL